MAELMEIELIRNAAKRGITKGEFSWILEDNAVMRQGLEKMGARVYRTYRMYDVSTAAPSSA